MTLTSMRSASRYLEEAPRCAGWPSERRPPADRRPGDPSTSRCRAALPQQTEAAVREILERVETTKIPASATLEGEDSSQPNDGHRILIGAAVAVVLLVIGVGVAAVAGAFNRSGPASVQNIFPPATSSSTVAPVSTVTVPVVMGQQLRPHRNLGPRAWASPPPPSPATSHHLDRPVRIQRAVPEWIEDRGSYSRSWPPNANSRASHDRAIPGTSGESLSQAGLEAGSLREAGETSVPGIVTSQSPAAGSVVVPQSIVALTVSS